MSSRNKHSLRQMIAALDDDQRRRLNAAVDDRVSSRQARTRLTQFVAWRLLTESRRAELAIARKLECLRHA